MSQLRIGDNAPDFRVKGVLRGQVVEYSLSSYPGKWLVLFFYPADFTFICPTEVTGFSKMAKEFSSENAAILGASVDSIDSHRAWAEELGGLEYPLLSDEDKTVSRTYGVLNEKEGVSLRATFMINEKRSRLRERLYSPRRTRSSRRFSSPELLFPSCSL